MVAAIVAAEIFSVRPSRESAPFVASKILLNAGRTLVSAMFHASFYVARAHAYSLILEVLVRAHADARVDDLA